MCSLSAASEPGQDETLLIDSLTVLAKSPGASLVAVWKVAHTSPAQRRCTSRTVENVLDLEAEATDFRLVYDTIRSHETIDMPPQCAQTSEPTHIGPKFVAKS